MQGSSVLAKIRTREDLEYLVSDLEELRVNLYKVKNGHSIPEIIRSEFDRAPDKNAFLETMRKLLITARVMELTVPSYLEEDAINKISAWVKRNISENVVLKLKVDESLMAGALISYNGKFKDYSFKEALTETVKNITI